MSDLAHLLNKYAGINPPGICWLWPDDTGLSYCFECAEEQINYFGRGTNVDGGWGGQEHDCCVHCETCGRMLDYSLTDAGVEYEIDHFSKLRFRKPLSWDDAARIARMVDAAPENKRVICIARRALRAAGIMEEKT
jgi:hypothetical protein